MPIMEGGRCGRRRRLATEWLSRYVDENKPAPERQQQRGRGRAVIAHPFSTASFSPVNMVLHVVEARSASS